MHIYSSNDLIGVNVSGLSQGDLHFTKKSTMTIGRKMAKPASKLREFLDCTLVDLDGAEKLRKS